MTTPLLTAERVVVGMDPHKRSVTIEVMTADETVLGGGRFATDTAGFTAMLAYVTRWPDRVWAVEGCSGIGRHVALRLVTAGEEVVDVPPKLSARRGSSPPGRAARPTPPTPTPWRWSAPTCPGCDPSCATPTSRCCGCLVDRRRSLGEEHTRKVSQLHALLLELLVGAGDPSREGEGARHQ